jgi:hypothetical protein
VVGGNEENRLGSNCEPREYEAAVSSILCKTFHSGFQSEILKRRTYLGDLDVNERIILKCVLKKYGMYVCMYVWTEFMRP